MELGDKRHELKSMGSIQSLQEGLEGRFEGSLKFECSNGDLLDLVFGHKPLKGPRMRLEGGE